MHDRCGVFSIRFLKMSELISIDRGKGLHLLWGFVNHKSQGTSSWSGTCRPCLQSGIGFYIVIAFLVASKCK